MGKPERRTEHCRPLTRVIHVDGATTPNELGDQFREPFKRVYGHVVLVLSIHVESIPASLGLRKDASPKRQTARAPDRVLGPDHCQGFVALRRLGRVPFFDRFVERTGDDLVVGEPGPVHSVDFGIVGVDLVDGLRAFLLGMLVKPRGRERREFYPFIPDEDLLVVRRGEDVRVAKVPLDLGGRFWDEVIGVVNDIVVVSPLPLNADRPDNESISEHFWR